MNGIDKYLELNVRSATPWQLHLMVVEEALKFATGCQAALQGRSFEDAHLCAARAREYVAEMISGIQNDSAPQLTSTVKDYFLHIQKNLHLADMSQDLQAAQVAVKLLQSYRETWLELRSRMAV